ncbi:hypothetical protein LINGRAHAP2_LOCUS7999 [Linum grandiflorum]
MEIESEETRYAMSDPVTKRMKNNKKNTRVAVFRDTHPSESLEDDEETWFRARQKVLFQEFLNLQETFVSKKKQLEFAKERRQTLLHEVQFLRRRRAHLLKIQSDEQERLMSVQAPVDVKRKSANGSLDRSNKKKKKGKTDKHNDFARYELPP